MARGDKPKTKKVRLLVDELNVFEDDGTRKVHKKGDVIALPTARAQELDEAGAVEDPGASEQRRLDSLDAERDRLEAEISRLQDAADSLDDKPQRRGRAAAPPKPPEDEKPQDENVQTPGTGEAPSDQPPADVGQGKDGPEGDQSVAS